MGRADEVIVQEMLANDCSDKILTLVDKFAFLEQLCGCSQLFRLLGKQPT